MLQKQQILKNVTAYVDTRDKSDYLNGKSINPITSRHFILMLEIHNNT